MIVYSLDELLNLLILAIHLSRDKISPHLVVEGTELGKGAFSGQFLLKVWKNKPVTQ